jgi:hypothetical protein
MASLMKSFAGKPLHAPLVNLFGIPATSPARTLGWWHLTVMASATGMFAGTFQVQLAGYYDGTAITTALILGVIYWALLVVGGYLGGTLTFVYGVWVLKHPNAAIADALIPGRSTEAGSH